MQCHSAAAHKGNLSLEAPLSAEKKLEIIRRVSLPPDAPDAMPPTKAKHAAVTEDEASQLFEFLTKK
jgi:hypothetical protein